jgi:hypothetical protein
MCFNRSTSQRRFVLTKQNKLYNLKRGEYFFSRIREVGSTKDGLLSLFSSYLLKINNVRIVLKKGE